MQIDVRQAQISTATVEIKTLSVNGKQVTMGLFRQLLREDWVDSFGDECGTAWGTVNYFFGSCDADHLHIVWQQGDTLRRGCLYKPGRGCQIQERLTNLRFDIETVERAWGLQRCLEQEPRWDAERGLFLWDDGSKWGGPNNTTPRSSYPIFKHMQPYLPNEMVFDRESVTKLLNECEREMAQSGLSANQWWQLRREITETRGVILQKWQASYDRALLLPQLFIAV